MINIDTIEQEILNMEKHDTTYATIERLAWLYIVRDHLKAYEDCNKTTGDLIGTEFCKACSNVPMQPLMEILSEHMEQISLLYPSEYDSLIRKIEEL